MFGRWDAEAFLDEIDADQFDHWKAFAEIEPFDPWTDDQRNAIGLAMQSRNPKAKPTDFMTCKIPKEPVKKKVPLSVLREQMEAAIGKPNGKH